MEFSLHESFVELESIAEEWNALLSESITHVPFLRHEYLRAWWEMRGGGEWPDSELAVVTARRQGRLAGVAPLFSARNREGKPALLLLGSIEISDYLDLIVQPGDVAEFIPGLFDFLAARRQDWHLLDWHNLLESSPTLPVMQAEAGRHGWVFDRQQTYHAPSIPLAGDFETYLSGIDKKQRHEIRRKMRRAEESDGGVRWYVVTEAASLDSEVEAFLQLMREEAHKANFLTEAMARQMQLICRAAFESGWLQLAFLEADGQKVAGYLNFDYQDRIWVYNSGIDRRFMELSPGWVLLGYLLQWANDNRRLEFDFMRGEEEYKYRFGGVDKLLVRATVTR